MICGYPRSGTSLFYNMMAQSLRGFDYHEFENDCHLYIFRRVDWLSKRPLDVFRVPQLPARNMFGKQIDVIVMIRDLRDVMTSVHPRVPDDYFIGFDACYQVDGPNGAALVMPGIQSIFQQIEQIQTLRGLRVTAIRYEDLIEDPDAVQQRLSGLLAFEFAGPFSSFHKAGAKLPYRYEGRTAAKDESLVRETNPVDRSRSGKWRQPKYLERVVSEFRSHPELHQMLKVYGYENDDRWFTAMLKAVSAAQNDAASAVRAC